MLLVLVRSKRQVRILISLCLQSRFGGGNRGLKKQGVIDRLKAFFEKFFGIGGSFSMGTSETLEEADNSSKS